MVEREDLWTKVGNKCLTHAAVLLESETAPTEATAETVKTLVETAISIDMLNLRWEQHRKGRAVPAANFQHDH